MQKTWSLPRPAAPPLASVDALGRRDTLAAKLFPVGRRCPVANHGKLPRHREPGHGRVLGRVVAACSCSGVEAGEADEGSSAARRMTSLPFTCPSISPAASPFPITAPFVVGVDGLPLRLAKGDLPGRVVGPACHRHNALDKRGPCKRPLDRLHAAEAAAHHGSKLLHLQDLARQPLVQRDSVADRDLGCAAGRQDG